MKKNASSKRDRALVKRGVKIKKTEWGFRPTLGRKIEPTITREEFEDILTRLSEPIREQTDPKKKET